MVKLLSVEEELPILRQKINFWRIVFAVAVAVWGITVSLLLLFSAKQYLINLIINVILTIAFGWFAVWIFTVPHSMLSAKIKLYKTAYNATEHAEFLTYKGALGTHIREGVEVYSYAFLDSKGNEKNIDCPIDIARSFEENTVYTVQTLANILVACEVKK